MSEIFINSQKFQKYSENFRDFQKYSEILRNAQKRSLLGAFGGLFGGSGVSWGPFLELPGPLGELLGSLLGALEALRELSGGFGCNLELRGSQKGYFEVQKRSKSEFF